MCMMLYIGADNELPLMKFREKKSVISVRKLISDLSEDSLAKKRLTKKYKYFIGSWQGCACGFAFDFPEAAREISELDEKQKQEMEAYFKKSVEDFIYESHIKGKQSVQALIDYIRDNTSGDSELVSFWADNVDDAVWESDGVIDLKSFVLGDSFKFSERQYITICK